MDQTTSNLTFSHYYEINKHTAPSHQLSVMDDIQLQTKSCYQITNASRMAGQDILESNYTVHGVDSINQLHQNHGSVSSYLDQLVMILKVVYVQISQVTPLKISFLKYLKYTSNKQKNTSD